jgi:protein-L-isoaspartate O-methyltransferase
MTPSTMPESPNKPPNEPPVTAGPTVTFWQHRFESADLPWDRGQSSPQLGAWLSAGVLRPGESVIVPGCGSGHEVAALAAARCTVTGLDYAPAAVEMTRERLRIAGQQAEVHIADVLDWQPALPADAIYEQTCLCALHPDLWVRYAAQLKAWLRPGGKLCALFMQVRRESAGQGVVEGPPYHCDINAMRALFSSAQWVWPRPPYDTVPHPRGWAELAVVLVRR